MEPIGALAAMAGAAFFAATLLPAQSEAGDDEVIAHFGLGLTGRGGLETGGHELHEPFRYGRDGGNEPDPTPTANARR